MITEYIEHRKRLAKARGKQNYAIFPQKEEEQLREFVRFAKGHYEDPRWSNVEYNGLMEYFSIVGRYKGQGAASSRIKTLRGFFWYWVRQGKLKNNPLGHTSRKY